jgi:enoyl-CoA hydratase/carnithine racemase
MQDQTVDTDSDDLVVTRTDHVMTIRLNREGKRNSITYAMYRALVALIVSAEQDTAIRCLVLASTGSIFTAGHDVSGFTQGMDLAYDEKPSFLFMEALSNFPKPVIAALNGDAVGIGATMLFHCDLVYAVPDCRLVFPFAEMGLIPEFASSYFLPRIMGHKRAMSLLLKDRRCAIDEAVRLGIVNATVSREALSAHVAETAAGIAALSPDAVAMTKKLLKTDGRQAVQAAIREEAEGFHDLLQSPFVRDRLAAIRQRISGG